MISSILPSKRSLAALAHATFFGGMVLFCGPLSAGPLNVTVQRNTLNFETPDLSFTGGSPQVVLLEKPGAKPFVVESPQPWPDAEPVQARQTPAGKASAWTWRWNDSRGYDVTWTLCALSERPGFTVQMTFSNRTKVPVRLKEFNLVRAIAGGLKVKGSPSDWFLSTLDSHDSAVGGFHRSGDLGTKADRQFLDIATLYTGHGSRGMVCGAVGPGESDVRIRCPVAGGSTGIDIASEMNTIVVDPGETRRSEEVLVLAEPYGQAIPTLFRWLASTHGSRTNRGPISGWCSWYSGGPRVDEKKTDRICRVTGTAPDQIPWQVIQIDDGWQKAYGNWDVNTNKFPNGMKPVADKILAAGAVPGIWLCPVRSSKDGAHPDGKKNEYLDASDPAVQEFVRTILKARVAEGFRYFKLDFMWITKLETRYNQKKTRLQIARDLYKIYRDSIGEDAYLDACVGGLNRACYGYADSARIGSDIGSDFSKGIGRLYKGCTIVDCISAIGSTAPANGILFANDPDVTFTRLDDLNTPAIRTWHSFVGLLGGLMMTSDEIRREDAQKRHNMELLMPPAPDKGRAFDGQTDIVHQRFGFVAKRPWGDFVSVLLWNPSETSEDLPLKGVPTQELGRKFHVWSFWDERYLGVADDSFVANQIPKFGGVVLRLTALPADPLHPVIVGSSLHLGMGSAEIADVQQARNKLTILLRDAGAREGRLVIYSPRSLRQLTAQGCEASLASSGTNLWTVSLAKRQRNQPQRIDLEVGSGN